MALEIERKFLLRNLPKVEWDIVYNIIQIYCEKDGERYRLRERKSETKTEYFRTVKTEIEKGVYEEEETEVTMQDFLDGLDYETKRLTKRRYVKNFTNGLKWEVDDFGKLVIAEIETKTKGQHIDIPEYISDVLIMEVTEFDQFKNFNLAKAA